MKTREEIEAQIRLHEQLEKSAWQISEATPDKRWEGYWGNIAQSHIDRADSLRWVLKDGITK